jgi:hypothetical protein
VTEQTIRQGGILLPIPAAGLTQDDHAAHQRPARVAQSWEFVGEDHEAYGQPGRHGRQVLAVDGLGVLPGDGQQALDHGRDIASPGQSRIGDDGERFPEQGPQPEVSAQAGKSGCHHVVDADQSAKDASNRSLAAALGTHDQEKLLLAGVRQQAAAKPFLQGVDGSTIIGPTVTQEPEPLRRHCGPQIAIVIESV